MRKLFKERKVFKGGNYMRKYGIWPPLVAIFLTLWVWEAFGATEAFYSELVLVAYMHSVAD